MSFGNRTVGGTGVAVMGSVAQMSMSRSPSDMIYEFISSSPYFYFIYNIIVSFPLF
jgi:hypothetical protein